MTPGRRKDGDAAAASGSSPGQTFQLPGGRGSDHLRRRSSASPACRSAPTRARRSPWSAALLALAGLIASLVIRRRRVFVRVAPGDRAGHVPWSPSAASPRTTTPGCPTTVEDRPAHASKKRRMATDDRDHSPAYANLALYSAMAVFTLAMLAYAVYLAGARAAAAPSAAEPRARARSWSAAGGAGGRRPAAPARRGRRPAGRSRPAGGRRRCRCAARKAAGIALDPDLARHPRCSSPSVVLRGARRCTAGRWATCSSSPSSARCSWCWRYCAGRTRRDLRWLGLFVVAPGAAHPRAGHHRLVHRGRRADAVAEERLAGHPRHRGDPVGGAVHHRRSRSASSTSSRSRLEAATGPLRVSFMSRLPERPGAGALGLQPAHRRVPAVDLHRSSPARSGRARPGARYWNWDPKEVWTLRHLGRLRRLPARARDDRLAAAQSAVWIALAGYGCILVNFTVVNVFFVGQHSYSGL